MAWGGYKRPEAIRSEPWQDFKFVYNRHWGSTLLSGSFSMSGNIASELANNLRVFYCHLRLMEASLSLFIKNKEKYEEETRDCRTLINEAIRGKINLAVYENQIKFFEALTIWLEKILPYMRNAGVIPLEEEDFEMNPEDRRD